MDKILLQVFRTCVPWQRKGKERETDEKFQAVIWGNQLGTGIFFKDMSLGENTSVLATLDPTHQMPFLCWTLEHSNVASTTVMRADDPITADFYFLPIPATVSSEAEPILPATLNQPTSVSSLKLGST